MIANEEQLVIVRGQAANLESALESLSRSVRPKNERLFRLMAEGYVDQLRIIRDDIDAYLGISPERSFDPEVEVSIEGPNAALGDTRVSAVTKVIDRFRRALRTTVGSVRDSLAMADRENVTEQFLDRLCDPPLQAIAPGSVKVRLGKPEVAVGSQLYADGLQLLSVAIRSIAGETQATDELKKFTLEQQTAALSATKLLAPEKDDSTTYIGLGGRFLGEDRHIQFDIDTRKQIQRKIDAILGQPTTKSVRGVIREVDFDRRLFTLREPGGMLTIQRCKYRRQFDEDVERLVNSPVEVSGTIRMNKLRATPLHVKSIVEATKEQ